MGSWFAFWDNGGVVRPETVLPVSRVDLRSGAGWRVRGVRLSESGDVAMASAVADVCRGYDRDDGLYNLRCL